MVEVTPVYLADRDLAARYRVSRVTVWRWCRQGLLPTPIKLSAQCSRWLFSEVEAYEQRLLAGRQCARGEKE